MNSNKIQSIGLIIIGSLFLTSTTAFAQHTYYISKSTGSDSNTSAQAQSKSTPWAHLRGMPSCTANCASYTPQPGDSFVLKGGDTWTASDLGVNWAWSGTSGAHIYIGTDLTWFSGSSWARPIFDCQTTDCAQDTFDMILMLGGNWTSLDNIEFKNFQQGAAGGKKLVGIMGNDTEVSNMYIHAFSRTAGSSGQNSFCFSNNWSSGGAQRTKFHDNICDGEDSPNKDFMGGILHGDIVYNNVIRYVYNGMNGLFNDVHGNLVEHVYIEHFGRPLQQYLHPRDLQRRYIPLRLQQYCAAHGLQRGFDTLDGRRKWPHHLDL